MVEYPALARYFEEGHRALGTDFFRYAMQARGVGTWVDLDLYFLRPLDIDDDYLFGWEHRPRSTARSCGCRPISAMVRDLCAIPQLNWRPPFYGPRRSLKFYWRRLTQGDLRPEDYRWGTFGAGGLTWLARKHGSRTGRRSGRCSIPSVTAT